MRDSVSPVFPDDESGYGPLECEFSRPGPGVLVLAVSGEIDTLTAPDLTTALRELVTGDEPALAVDLTEVTFLASSGLAALVDSARAADRTGRRLRLVAEGRTVLRPLVITATDQLFDIFPDRASALAQT